VVALPQQVAVGGVLHEVTIRDIAEREGLGVPDHDWVFIRVECDLITGVPAVAGLTDGAVPEQRAVWRVLEKEEIEAAIRGNTDPRTAGDVGVSRTVDPDVLRLVVVAGQPIASLPEDVAVGVVFDGRRIHDDRFKRRSWIIFVGPAGHEHITGGVNGDGVCLGAPLTPPRP
jgi:hypothetical protein